MWGVMQIGGTLTRRAAASAGICLHHTGIDREAFTTHQTLAHAALDNAFEHVAKGITVTKATMSILREGRMVRHHIFETQAAEPAVRQVQVNLLTQAAFGADPEAVSDDQHADHQLRINGRSARMAVERSEVLAKLAKLEEPINAPEQVIGRDMIIEIKGVEQLLLATSPLSHHLGYSRLLVFTSA